MTPDDAMGDFLTQLSPPHDSIQQEMAEFADQEGFPIIGRQAGGVLKLLAQSRNARSLFEFGSGFGYSAYWFWLGMADNAELVLTEVDPDELEMATELFTKAGIAEQTHFEVGDAQDIVDRYAGPFDLVLIDHQKSQYPDAFDAIREKVAEGGIIVADNILRESVIAAYTATDSPSLDTSTHGLVTYLELVRTDPAFSTVVVPVGNGITVSMKT